MHQSHAGRVWRVCHYARTSMNAWPLTAIALVATPAQAVQLEATEPAREDSLAVASDPKRNPAARPSDEAIRQAIHDTLAEQKDDVSFTQGTALSGNPYREFARQFSQARKGHCLGPDALKHQPSSFQTKDWTFGAGGVLAAPFWAAAIARGKCSWGG